MARWRRAVHNRTDFAASMIDGRTVGDVDPNSRSAKEISALWLYLSDRIQRLKGDPEVLFNGRKHSFDTEMLTPEPGSYREKEIPAPIAAAPEVAPKKEIPAPIAAAPKIAPKKEIPASIAAAPKIAPKKEIPASIAAAPKIAPKKEIPAPIAAAPKVAPKKEIPAPIAAAPKPDEQPQGWVEARLAALRPRCRLKSSGASSIRSRRLSSRSAARTSPGMASSAARSIAVRHLACLNDAKGRSSVNVERPERPSSI